MNIYIALSQPHHNEDIECVEDLLIGVSASREDCIKIACKKLKIAVEKTSIITEDDNPHCLLVKDIGNFGAVLCVILQKSIP